MYGQVFLRGRRGTDTFPIQFFQDFSFLRLEINLPFAKLYDAFEENSFFQPSKCCEEGHSKLSKNGRG